jgi:oligopeptidase B
MTVFDYEIKTKRLISKKVRFSGHNDKDYVYKRVMVPSKDGVKVPATIIYNKKYQNRHRPAHLYVYGAYGEGITPEFPSFALSLIDRGITYVIAHVRGGNELGKQWHEDGKFLKKKNSFYDFIAVADYLVSNNFVKKGNLSASGESAAGLVIGYAVNARPDLFKAITMLVPFVDALNSLMDESLPYTYFDKSEFGDPVNNQEYYDYIKSYAPFNNIQKHKYPHIYVTSGVNDIAVGYWEPMKWLAKIRKYQTNKSETYLAVHGGGHIQSGLHSVNMDFAKQIAFLLTMHDKE